MSIKIIKDLVVVGDKIGLITETDGQSVFVEPSPQNISMLSSEPANCDSYGCWHNKSEVISLKEHIENLIRPDILGEDLS